MLKKMAAFCASLLMVLASGGCVNNNRQEKKKALPTVVLCQLSDMFNNIDIGEFVRNAIVKIMKIPPAARVVFFMGILFDIF